MTAPEHDPERCATCSGKRDDRLKPIREAVAEYLNDVVEILKAAQPPADDGPTSDGRWA